MIKSGSGTYRVQWHVDSSYRSVDNIHESAEVLFIESGSEACMVQFAADKDEPASDIDTDPIYGDSDGSDAEDVEQLTEEIEYVVETAGRELGEQPVSRFDLAKLRPFEVMFSDNKLRTIYPCKVRGGKQTTFVLIDYYSQARFKVDVARKSDNGDAFNKIAIMNGVHKLPYTCRAWTDGCGSMAHVKDAAIRLGIDHAYTPPREPSLNEAEKVCSTMLVAARTHIRATGAP